MTTTLYLRGFPATTSLGTNTANQRGTATDWRSQAWLAEAGGLTTTATVTSVTGPTAGLEVGSPALEWISSPLSAAATVAGTVSFRIIAHESNAAANATIAMRVDRLDSAGAIVSTVVDSSFGTEVGTTAAARTWTATPTSTSFAKGDRIRAVAYFDDATAVTMATGYTLTLTYDNIGTNQNSYVELTEDLTFSDVLWKVTSTGSTQVLRDVAYSSADDRYVAIGDGGTIRYSSDALAWSSATSGTAAQLFHALYETTDDLFVVVGENGTILTSPEGTAWTSRTSNTANTLRGIAYSAADDVYVTVGLSSTIRTSSDAITWGTATAAGVTDNLFGVTYGGADDLFVAVGASGRLLTSPNGTTWTSRTSGVAGNLLDVIYSSEKDLFVAVGGSGAIITSANGTAWTTQTSNTTANLNSVAYSDDHDLFVALGGGALVTSPNGTDWTVRLQQTATALFRVRYIAADGLWFAVGGGGAMRTSPNGIYGNAVVQSLYLTGTPSDIGDQGTVELKAWTTRGTG